MKRCTDSIDTPDGLVAVSDRAARQAVAKGLTPKDLGFYERVREGVEEAGWHYRKICALSEKGNGSVPYTETEDSAMRLMLAAYNARQDGETGFAERFYTEMRKAGWTFRG